MGSAPIGDAEFGEAMEPFGPWPAGPRVAVAVSGGPDSMALLWLAGDWATKLGGTVLALTVDHGLRVGAAAEARRVADFCADAGIDHRILRWQPPPGRVGQAAARSARYGLLDRACGEAGIIHLLVGHTADDQAETVLLRQDAGSGPLGLSGMPTRRILDNCRVLRPLLAFSRSATQATCRAAGVMPIADPTNLDRRFARVRARQALAGDPDRRSALLATAAQAGRVRQDSEARLADLLARTVRIRAEAEVPWGFVMSLTVMDNPRAPEVLAAVIRAVGGRAHAPAASACRRALDRVKTGRARQTLGRCLIASGRQGITVSPEPPRRGAVGGASICPHFPLAAARFAVVYPRVKLT